jgi:glycerol-3-phosphate O-acyltransferase
VLFFFAHSQEGACGCNASTKNLDAPAKNLQNIKNKDADQPAKKLATHYRNHVLHLLNRRRWKQLIFKKYLYMQDVLCKVIERIA